MLDELYNKAKELKEAKERFLELSQMLKNGDDISVDYIMNTAVYENILEDCDVPKKENLKIALNYALKEIYEQALQYLMPLIAYINKPISNLVFEMKKIIAEVE